MIVEQAVFLVGGMGSRLKELTSATAKPVLEVGGRFVLPVGLTQVVAPDDETLAHRPLPSEAVRSVSRMIGNSRSVCS